jgi:hypothetical protein
MRRRGCSRRARSRGTYAFDAQDGGTPELVVALASDVAGVLRAEALCFEVARRVACVHPNAVAAARWCVVRHGRGARTLRGSGLGVGLLDPVLSRHRAEARSLAERAVATLARGAGPCDAAAVSRVVGEVESAHAWALAAASGDPRAQGPSPFEPLLDLCAAGYILDGFTASLACLATPEAL